MNTIRDYAYQTAKLPELDSEPLVVMTRKNAIKLALVLNSAQFVTNYRPYVDAMRQLEDDIDRSKK